MSQAGRADVYNNRKEADHSRESGDHLQYIGGHGVPSGIGLDLMLAPRQTEALGKPNTHTQTQNSQKAPYGMLIPGVQFCT